MKKVILGIVAILIMILFGLVSCTKTNVIREGKELSSAGSFISGDVNLDSFETVFDYDSTTGDLNVIFSEPEDIVLHPEQANELGFRNLTLSKGLYVLTIPSDSSNYGEIEIDVVDYSLLGDEAIPAVGTGIIIAKLWDQCNGVGPIVYCLCGIGFRCSFIKSAFEKATYISNDASRVAYGNIYFDPSSVKLKIVFTSPLPPLL